MPRIEAGTRRARSNHEIPYDKAVAEGRALIKKKDADDRRVQLRLGELAARVEPFYRDRTLARFAKEIGVSACTLARYRSVWRAWAGMGKEAPGPVSYAVLRELQEHPKREEIVKENPRITKREAQQLQREHEGKRKNKSGDFKREETKRLLRQLRILADDVSRTTAALRDERVAHALREILEPEMVATLLPTLREGSAALLSLAERLEHQDGQIEEAKSEDIAA